MSDQPPPNASKHDPTLARQVGVKAHRKLTAHRHSAQRIWFGLGMIGVIGWSVVVPTLLGVALGLWLDKHDPSPRSWTLMLLLLGLLIGCATAWHWVVKEDRAIRNEQKDNHD